MTKKRTWQVTSYELLSFQLTTDYVAVYADEPGEDGFSELSSFPVDAIGLARVTTRTFSGDGSNRRAIGKPIIMTQLVGLELSEGWFDIVDECKNFAGLAKVGQDISDATGCLEGDFRLHPRPESKSKVTHDFHDR